jgi:uncharacterized membrane protein YdjX (TVP38/TMEM64 family)
MRKKSQKKFDKSRLLNIAVILSLTAVVLLSLYGWQIGLFRDLETLRAFIDQAGIWAPVAFIMLHLLQIIVPFIPGGVVLTAGVLIFGPLEGFILNYIGTVLGSGISFALARHYGKEFVHQKISPAVWQKYFRWLDNAKLFRRIFAIMIVLPFAPDDALCMLAGISDMTVLEFALIIMLFKIPMLLVYSLTMFGADMLL